MKRRLPKREKQPLIIPLSANDTLSMTWRWMDDYNNYRPHDSLGDLSPME